MWKYYIFRLAYLLLGRLSLRALYGISRVTSDASYRLRRDTRNAVASNMRRLLGPNATEDEVQQATREVFRNAGRYYADLMHVGRLDVERFYDERYEIEGEEYLHAAKDSGRGAVLVGTHFGNPEMAVQPLASKGFSIMGLVESLEPKALSDFTLWLREQQGHVYRTIGYAGLKETIRRLKSGGLVAILIDRDVAGTGVPMQFCGAEASISVGAVDLAMRTGADLIPARSWRLPGYRFKVIVEPPMELIRTGDFEADVRSNTKRLLPLFEDLLRSDPGQWAVLEAIWKDQPAQEGTVQ